MSGLSHIVIPMQKILCVGCIVEPVCREKCPHMIGAIDKITRRMVERRITNIWQPLIPQTDEQMDTIQDTIREVSKEAYIERINGG